MNKEEILYLKGKGYSIGDIQSITESEDTEDIESIIKDNLPTEVDEALNTIRALERDVALSLADAKARGRGDTTQLMKMRMELLSKRVSILEISSEKKKPEPKRKTQSLDQWKK